MNYVTKRTSHARLALRASLALGLLTATLCAQPPAYAPAPNNAANSCSNPAVTPVPAFINNLQSGNIYSNLTRLQQLAGQISADSKRLVQCAQREQAASGQQPSGYISPARAWVLAARFRSICSTEIGLCMKGTTAASYGACVQRTQACEQAAYYSSLASHVRN